MRNLIISIMLSLFLLFPMTINAGYIDSSGEHNPANIDFNVSKNVTITYAVSAGQDGFCAISSHKLGDTLYGGGSDTTLVFKYVGGKNKGADYRTDPAANATAAFSAPDGDENWKPM